VSTSFAAARARLSARLTHAARNADVLTGAGSCRDLVSSDYRALRAYFDDRLRAHLNCQLDARQLAGELLPHFEAVECPKAQLAAALLRAVERANLLSGLTYAVLNEAVHSLPDR